MNIFESISSALSGITGNKMRSILTMFGIVVGISSVIMITSIGQGYKATISKQFDDIGLDRFNLITNGDNVTIEEQDMLTYDDVLNLRKYSEVAHVTGSRNIYLNAAVTLMDQNKTRAVYINGVDTEYFNVEKIELTAGRYIIEQDLKGCSAVVIIDEDFAKQIYGSATEAIGKKLQISSYWNELECTIVGVEKSNQSSQMMALYDQYAAVYMPLTYVNESFWEYPYIDSVMIKGTDANDLKRIGDNVIRLTEMQHNNAGGDKYKVRMAADNLAEVNTIINIFTVFMGLVAAISLLVGGIGVMNIMLVSVTERTREIGIRKSLGATSGNIKLQFLIEAVILTGIGGVVGILLGYSGGIGLGSLATMMLGEQITPVLTTESVVIVVGISAAIGIIFGVYPAGRAAKLDPIEALRFDN